MGDSADWKVGARVTLIEGTTYEHLVGSIEKATAKTLLIDLDGKDGPPVRVHKSSARLLMTHKVKKRRESVGARKNETNPVDKGSIADEVPSLLNPTNNDIDTDAKETTMFEPTMSPVQVIKGVHEGKHGVVEKETDKTVTINCQGERFRILKSSVKKRPAHRVSFALPEMSPQMKQLKTTPTDVPSSELRPVKLFGGERRKSLESVLKTTSESVQRKRLTTMSIAVLLVAVFMAGKLFVASEAGFDLGDYASATTDLISTHSTQVFENATSIMANASHGIQKIVKEAVSMNWVPVHFQGA